MGTHLGKKKLKELLRHLRFMIFNMGKLVEDWLTKCLLCQATNPQKKGFSQDKRGRNFPWSPLGNGFH